MDDARRKKLISELACLAIFLVILVIMYPMLSKAAAKRTAQAYWTQEDEMHRRRLFGDAWKDV